MLLRSHQSGLVLSHIKILMLKICAKLKTEEKENICTNHQQGREADRERGIILFYAPKPKSKAKNQIESFISPLR